MNETKIKARMERQAKIMELVKSGQSLTDISKLWNVQYGVVIYDVNRMPPTMRKELNEFIFSGRRKLTFSETDIQAYSHQLIELSKINKSLGEIAAALNKPLSFLRKLFPKLPKEIRLQIKSNTKSQKRDSANKKFQIEKFVREGKKQREIAQILGIKQNTVSSHIKHLPPKLRNELRKLMRIRKAKEDAEMWAKKKEEQKTVPPAETPPKPIEIVTSTPFPSNS